MATKLVVPYDNPQALMGAGVIVFMSHLCKGCWKKVMGGGGQ